MLGGTVEPAHAAKLELEVIPLGLGHVVQLVFVSVQRTGGHFMQQRLPNMGQVGVDKGDVSSATLAQGLAQARRKLQTASATANNQNTVCH
ncbi:hypothetical protein D3C86_1553190 [compost metagenome]